MSKWIDKLALLSLIVGLGVTLSGCGPTPTPPSSTAKYVKISIEKIEEPPKVEELRAMLQKPPQISFTAMIRDPFVPPIQLKAKGLESIEVEEAKTQAEEKVAKKGETPKEKTMEEKKAEYIESAITRGVLIVRGIMGAGDKYDAILELPTGETVIISDGMLIKNYKIVKITPEKVIIVNTLTQQKMDVPIKKI